MGAQKRQVWMIFTLLVLGLVVWLAPAQAEVLGRFGQGWLESIDGYPVLHVKGSPYDMGRQHGELLREQVQKNLENLLKVEAQNVVFQWGPFQLGPRKIIENIVKLQEPFVPEKYFEELRGLADGAGVSLDDARVANFLPELFHCSGFAVMNSATADGTLYHGRVLDYATDWGLQEYAVIVVAEPEGGIPFVNVTYAGFLGSVTGMNARHVSIGEMGGAGLGHWQGVPMAWLVREVLETAGTLDEAIAVFRDSPRTCQYFYVIADGKDNRAVGMEASWNKFELVHPGKRHPMLPNPSPDTVLLSVGDRYEELARRVSEGHGGFDAASALRLMDRPVAMSSNLHNVLFEPASTRFWVANAGPDGQPAAERKYHEFQLSRLLERRPE